MLRLPIRHRTGALVHFAVATAAVASPPAAQTPAALANAAAAITPEAIASHVGVIAHDSMLGRGTPSRGLELTAQYLAGQFARLGLKPGGERGTWFHRYSIPSHRQLIYAGTRMVLTTGLQRHQAPVVTERGRSLTKRGVIDFDATARFAANTVLSGRGWDAVSRTAVVVAGPHTLISVRQANLRNRIVFYVPSSNTDSATQGQVIDLLRTSNGVLILSSEDSATFAARREVASRAPPVVRVGSLDVLGWAAYVRPSALEEFLAVAGLDLAEVRAAATPVFRELPPITGSLQPSTRSQGVAASATNVVGVLDRGEVTRGSSGNYIVIAAHMDHLGVIPRQADSISNGADDNASGVAGLIELARAFSHPAALPRRGIIFVGLSGSAGNEFWGSRAWVNPMGNRLTDKRAVAMAINIDMIGREAGDSVRVDGLRDFEFAVRPEWIAELHPELRLTLVDGGSISIPKSDHFAFVRHTLPALYFYNGSHEDIRPDDIPAAIDAEQEARILRLIFYIAHDLAEAKEVPEWTTEGRRQWARAFGKSGP